MRSRAVVSFFGGALAVAALGSGILLVLAAAGLRRSPSLTLMAGVVIVVALAAWASSRQPSVAPLRAGAAVAGTAVVVRAFTLGDGLGQLEWLLVAAAALVVAAGPLLLRPLRRPVPRTVILLALVVLAAGLVRIVIGGGGFGHDESAYALKGRTWVQGTPETGWELHRGWIQSALAAGVLPFTDSELVMRLLSVSLTLATVVAVWLLGRSVRSGRAGLLAAAGFAISPSYLRRGAEFLTDVPSTGLLLVATVLVWRWLSDPEPRHRLLTWVTLIGAVAFYWRYQAILSLALLFIGVLLVGWRRVSENAGAVGRAVGLGALLLVPHFVYATVRTGRPWGILTWTGDVAGRDYLGQGLVDYARAFPDQLAGQVGAVGIVIGVVWCLSALARHHPEDRRLAVYLGVPAIGQSLFLGLVSHGEPRFLFYPIALLLVAGAVAVDRLASRVGEDWYRTGVAAVCAGLVAMLALNTDRADRNAEARAASTAIIERAAELVVSEADGACGVVTTYAPQITWFSGCVTDVPDRNEAVVDLEPGIDRFLLLFANGKRQPTGDVLDGYLALTAGEPVVINDPVDSIGDARIWRIGAGPGRAAH